MRGLRVEVNGVDVTEHAVSVDIGGQTFTHVDLKAVRDVDGYPGLVGADLCTCGPTTKAAGYCECGADPDSCPCADPGDCSGCDS